MRKRLLRVLGGVSTLASVVGLAVPAQAGEFSLKIPFAFIVNGKALAPGRYTVTSERSVLLVRGRHDGAAVVTNRAESRKPGHPNLVFYKYGDEYLFGEAWLGGEAGRVVPLSRVERERMVRRARSTLERIVVPAP